MIDRNTTTAAHAHSNHHRSTAVHSARLRCVTVAVSLALLGASPLLYAQSTAVPISIQQHSLSDALLQLGQQTSLQFIYTSDLVRGYSVQPITGRMSPEEALRRLLAGTGIEYSRDGNTINLWRPADSATQLGSITVTGRSLATTEDSGSYAARDVTIGKSAQSLREIPQSVSVMTRTQMDDQGFTRVADALNYTTGIRSSSYSDTELFTSRGFNTNIQYDGVPTQQGALGPGVPHHDLAIYDRLEVLRGPSGLLSGSGEPGGVINLVRKRPTDEFRFEGAVGVGSWDNYRVEADIAGPLTEDDKLRGRLVGVYQDKNQFYSYGKNNPQLLYGVLEYDLGENTTLGITGLYSKMNFRVFNGLPLYDDGSLPSYDTFLGTIKLSGHETFELGADIKHRFGDGWEFKANYSHKENNYKGYSAMALTPVSVETGLTSGWAGRIHNTFTWDQMDANVSGPFTLLGREHSVTVGYNWARYDTTSSSRFGAFPDWDAYNNFNYGSALDQPLLNKSQDITTQSGLYASTRLSLTDNLTAVLGGRWSNYDLKSRDLKPARSPWQKSDAKADGKFTPFAGLVFDVNEQISVYGSYAETFVPQSDSDYSGKTLEPRKGWQMEAGIKGEFLDGRLNTSLAVYRLRDTNRAVVDTDHVGCGNSATGTCYRASGLVQSQGWEFEVVGSPIVGWDLGASYTYTDVRVREDSDNDVKGQRFNSNLIPKHLFHVWSQYKFGADDFGGGLRGWSVGAGVQSQSNLYTNSVYQGGYTTVSAKLGYKPNEHWEAMLVINNLFDKRYLESVGHATFLNLYGAPRNAMLTLKYRY